MGRLTSGKVSTDRFDWSGLAFDYGAPGRAALARLNEAGIDLDDIGLRKPSLDDVFLALTGPAASEALTVPMNTAAGRRASMALPTREFQVAQVVAVTLGSTGVRGGSGVVVMMGTQLV